MPKPVNIINKARKTYAIIPTWKREILIKLVIEQSWTCTKACHYLGIKLTSGCLIVRTFRETGRIMQKSQVIEKKMTKKRKRSTKNITRKGRILARKTKRNPHKASKKNQIDLIKLEERQESPRDAPFIKIEDSEVLFTEKAENIVLNEPEQFSIVWYHSLIPTSYYPLCWFYMQSID